MGAARTAHCNGKLRVCVVLMPELFGRFQRRIPAWSDTGGAPTSTGRSVPGSMSPSDDLRDLVGRAQTRDPSAISELYDRFAGLMLRYISLRVAEHELAQDLTQEVFIKIIYGIGRFEYRDEKAFLGWLYTIAGNVLHSYQRRRRLQATPFGAQDDLIDQRSQDDARAITDRVMLQQAIGQLTKDQQQVLTLRFYADMSNSEIAKLLRRTEGAIKAIQYRALQSLQKILKREADDTQSSVVAAYPTGAYRRQPALNERELAKSVARAELPSAHLESRAGD